MITGKDLIELGYKPGKWFTEAIKEANELNLDGWHLSEHLKSVCPPPAIEPFENSVSFTRNIEAESAEEEANVKSVFDTMDVLMKTPTILDGAVMPDACPTGELGQIPVGGVVKTKGAIHPSMHSADICCSVMLTEFHGVEASKVLDAAQSATHFGPINYKDLYTLPEYLEEKILKNRYTKNLLPIAKKHLGTQGDGNHFLYIGTRESTGNVSMVTHHGSRGFGAKLYKEGMKIAERFRKELSPKTMKRNAWIPYDTDEGREYWAALQIIREWTKLNHEVIHTMTANLIEGIEIDRFWNEHNFVFKDDEDNFYHAKGATPLSNEFVPDARDGLRLIPLNMKEPILIVKGETTEGNLGFAPHGAGRNISRTAHKRKKEGKTIEEVFNEETEGLDVRFYSGNIDISELPSAYKDAEAVQRQMGQFELGEVVDRVLPYGCIMAGDFNIDAPWKKKKK